MSDTIVPEPLKIGPLDDIEMDRVINTAPSTSLYTEPISEILDKNETDKGEENLVNQDVISYSATRSSAGVAVSSDGIPTGMCSLIHLC